MLPLQEDPWNSIMAGAATGGVLQLRTGLRSAAKSAAFGGVLLVRARLSQPTSYHGLFSIVQADAQTDALCQSAMPRWSSEG